MSLAATIALAAALSSRNVVLVTWDGVRRDEFLGEVRGPAKRRQLFPYLWNVLAPRGRIYGDPAEAKTMTVSNPQFVSLPAYQSIFAGRTQPCTGNTCERIGVETFPERLVREAGFAAADVATFASWAKIPLAVEHTPGATFTNTGDPEELQDIPAWEDARLDKYTQRSALKYLTDRKPRFLYIALDDADELGHRGDYPRYLDALDAYDGWLEELVDTLRDLGAYGKNTCLIVTTDHGRGRGDGWVTHGANLPYSANVLMYAGCPLDPGPTPFADSPMMTSHLDIRPTIESLFGLPPAVCVQCGHALVAPAASSH